MEASMDAGYLAQTQAALFAQAGGAPAHLMSLGPSAVHIDTALSNVLVEYKNREYIAEEVLPVLNVTKRSDKIFTFPVDTYQTVAQAQVAGNRGMPGEINYALSTLSYAVSDFALMDFIGADEDENADPPLQPRVASTRILANFLRLAREIRAAGVIFATGNYTGSTSALSGANRWDTSTGAPVQNLLDGIATPLVRPNIAIFGEQAWTKFRNNAEVKSYVTGRSATTLGAVPFLMDEATVAAAFGLDAVYVGRAKYNSAREGATVSSTYVWGKSCALIRREKMLSPRDTACFAHTFRFGPWQTQVIPDQLRGVRGGIWVKASHSDAEVVLAGASAGYLYTTTVT